MENYIDINEKTLYRLLLWGTERTIHEVRENGLNGLIVGYIRTFQTKDKYSDYPTYEVDNLPQDFDYIIVTSPHLKEIYAACMQHNINIEKCIFFHELGTCVGEAQKEILLNILGEKNYTKYCVQHRLWKDTFFQEDMRQYNEMNTRETFQVQEEYLYPIIKDKYAMAGKMGSYFWQDLWAAKLIYQSGVKSHVDIGSRIDGFIAHLLAMDIDVTLIDVREFPEKVEKLHTIVSDATYLTQIEDESIESMSALCSIEHFGLGRYGDPIDPEACFKCFKNIQKKLKKGGNLYLSVPIGKERVEFNAHRVFYAKTVTDNFDQMDLLELSSVTDKNIEYHIAIDQYDKESCKWQPRFGLFHFIKK